MVAQPDSDRPSKIFLKVDGETRIEELVARLVASLFEDGVRGAARKSTSTGDQKRRMSHGYRGI
jgi:hypothetical protein